MDSKNDCQHSFIGTKDGVRCQKCGLWFTPEEYKEIMAGNSSQVKRKKQTPKRTQAKRKAEK